MPNIEFADVSNPEGELILTICRNSQQRDNKALWGGAPWKLNKSQLEKNKQAGELITCKGRLSPDNSAVQNSHTTPQFTLDSSVKKKKSLKFRLIPTLVCFN